MLKDVKGRTLKKENPLAWRRGDHLGGGGVAGVASHHMLTAKNISGKLPSISQMGFVSTCVEQNLWPLSSPVPAFDEIPHDGFWHKACKGFDAHCKTAKPWLLQNH